MPANDLERHVRALLRALDPEPEREGLVKTPARVARALTFLTKGHDEDPRAVINGALFSEESSEMIVLKDIDFYSLCEHHILPFFGKAHVAYLPNGKIVGISKLARLVEVFARRPLGVAVVLEAEHLCMRMRGVEKQNSTVVTSAMFGVFRDQQTTRQEFMNLIGRR